MLFPFGASTRLLLVGQVVQERFEGRLLLLRRERDGSLLDQLGNAEAQLPAVVCLLAHFFLHILGRFLLLLEHLRDRLALLFQALRPFLHHAANFLLDQLVGDLRRRSLADFIHERALAVHAGELLLLRAQEEQFARMNRERALMDEIRKRTTAEIADELIEEEVRGMVEEWAQRLEQQGKTIAEVLEQQKKSPEDVEKEMREQAHDRWKLRLGIAKLIEERSITLTPEEQQAAFESFLDNLPDEQKAGARAEWEKHGSLFEEVRWRALVDKLVDQMLG